MLKKLETHTVFALLLIFSLVLYGNTLSGDFLFLDDMSTIVTNPEILDFGKALASFRVLSISNSIGHQVFGMNPFFFHLKAILLHAINAFLVFLLVEQLFNKKAGILTAVLFLAHPANTEAIAWLSGNAYLFTGFFTFSIALLFAKFRRQKDNRYLFASLGMYALYIAGTRTAWVATIPLQIAALDLFLLGKKIDKQSAKTWAPFFVLALAFVAFAIPGQLGVRLDNLESSLVGVEAPSRLVTLGLTILRSVTLLLLPLKLSVYPDSFSYSPAEYGAVIAAVALVAATLTTSWLKNKKIFGLLLLIYISIAPTLSPWDLAINSAERYFYVSTAFFSAVTILVLAALEKKYKLSGLLPRVVLVILLLFSIRTIARNNDWNSEKNLWIATQKTAPGNYKAHNNLGNVYLQEGNLKKAFNSYMKALEIRPTYPLATHNVGLVLFAAGDLQQSKAFFIKSLELNPELFMSYYRLGNIELQLGNPQQAKLFFEETLKISPSYLPAQEELAKLTL